MKEEHVPTLNYLWSRCIIEELCRCGVRLFVVAPGARCAPLTNALSEFPEDKIRSVVHYDERGAGFFALGWAKASNTPTAVITTSGTAVANLLPAAVEASQSHIPIMFLTADRPFEVRESGANQTIDQTRILGAYTRFDADIPPPTEAVNTQNILTIIDQAVAHAKGPLPGPCHINLQFRQPLVEDVCISQANITSFFPKQWSDSDRPLTTWHRPSIVPSIAAIDAVIKKIHQSTHGVIIAGELRHKNEQKAAIALSKLLAWPILCDITSNLRAKSESLSSPRVEIAHYGVFLEQALLDNSQKPDCVIHLGTLPVSNALNKLIERCGGSVIQLTPFATRADPIGVVQDKITGDILETINSLVIRLEDYSRPSKLLSYYRSLDDAAASTINDILGIDSREVFSEWHVVNTLAEKIPNECAVYLGNSLPIREADTLFPLGHATCSIHVNRGASGIDGILALACGTAEALSKPLVAIVGDLTLLHDLNSLSLFQNRSKASVIIVINNDGGAIFGSLPDISILNCFEKMFRHPHGYNFADAANLFKLSYLRIEYGGSGGRQQFISALSQGLSQSKPATIIEVMCNNADTHRIRDALRELYLARSIPYDRAT